jgi:hypothetical protein
MFRTQEDLQQTNSRLGRLFDSIGYDGSLSKSRNSHILGKVVFLLDDDSNTPTTDSIAVDIFHFFFLTRDHKRGQLLPPPLLGKHRQKKFR